jgi:hypothetical protein
MAVQRTTSALSYITKLDISVECRNCGHSGRAENDESWFLEIYPSRVSFCGLPAWNNLIHKENNLSDALRQYLFW